MVTKMILNADENLSPAIVEWNDGKDDFIVSVPSGITRCDLIELVKEIRYLTKYDN